MPLYANTHTTSNACGEQSTRLVAEARDIISKNVGATEEGTERGR